MSRAPLTGDPVALRSEVARRSRRAALVGLAVAAVIGLLAIGGLLLLQHGTAAGPDEGLDRGDIVPAAAYIVVLLAIGAAAGLQTVSLSLAQQMQQTFGTGPQARQVRRVVLRGEKPSSADEAARAAAYAPAAAVIIPQQIVAGTLLLAAIGMNLLVQLLTLDVGPVLHALQAGLLLVLVGTAVALVPVQVRSVRRAQRYRPATDADHADAGG